MALGMVSKDLNRRANSLALFFGFWRKVGGKLFRSQPLSSRGVSIFHVCFFTISTAALKSSQRDERTSMPHASSGMVRQHKGPVCEGDQNLRVHTCFV